MNNADMKTVDGELYLSSRGVLKIIFLTVIFPDIQEIKAYYNCKRKISAIAELLAIRKYGKPKRDILKEVYTLKTKEELEIFIEKIYDKFIFQEDISDLIWR